ncbi:MAG: TIGR03936 family radical SAM-associated protein [Christensenellales bacterium]|jgi:radical SAM-linked protein
MRIIAVFKKTGGARYISHLDLQRAVQRALRRSELPIRYSMGFNPHPVLSFASALSLGFTSLGEVMDVAIAEDVSTAEFEERMAGELPPSLALISAHQVADNYPGLMSLVESADYEVTATVNPELTFDELSNRINSALSAPILAEKKTKAGVKELDLREQVLSLELRALEKGGRARFFVRCDCSPAGALNPKLLFDALSDRLGVMEEPEYCRLALWADKIGCTPLWGRKEPKA